MGSRLDMFKMPFMARDGAAAQAAAKPLRAATAHAAIGRRVKLLAILLAALLAVDGAIVVYDARQATFGTLYVAAVGKIRMLSQRIAKNANAMLAGDIVDPEVAFLLGKDSNTFRDLLQGLLQGNEALRITRVSDPELRTKLAELEGGFKDYQVSVSRILGNMQRLVNAKRATRDML